MKPPPDNPLDELAAGPIFVVGHPRSGTTWIFDILTAHPEVAGVLESWLFTRSIGLASLFDRQSWAPERFELSRRVLGRVIGLRQVVTRAELATEVRLLTGRLLGRKLEPGHRFLVEKTPSPHTDMRIVREVFPDSRFVHVVRDGRDVAVSLRAAGRSWNPQLEQDRLRGPLGRYRAVYGCGRSWRSTVEDIRGLGRRLGADYTEVEYEQVRAQPLECFRKLFDFCGIPYDEELLARIFGATDFHRRFEGGEDKFRRGGRVGDWRERFGVLDAIAFELGSRGYLVEAGYEPHRAWWARGGVRLRSNWPD